MAAVQFRDGSNESRLWKLIVPMKNKSANATRSSGDISGIIARETATLRPTIFW
jgi:hypothetical protein